MKRRARWLQKVLVAATALAVAATLFLELGSRFYRCPVSAEAPPLRVCDSTHYPVRSSQLEFIQTIVAARLRGLEPSREDLDRAINVVNYEDMPGLNGVLCGDQMIFVRSNLGEEGKYFVARHELEHVFRGQGIDRDCQKDEYCATMTAARAYPVGFVETILSSVYIAARESPTVWCFLFGAWGAFRAYITPW